MKAKGVPGFGTPFFFALTVFAIGSVGLVAPCGAQRVTGVVRGASAGPLAGAVISLVDSSGRSLARTITDTAGRYGLAWQPATARLRVVRMGFRPPSDLSLSGAPRDTVIDIALDRLPAMLAAVRVRSDALCSDSPDRRGALAVWDQARAGLLATIVGREIAAGRMTRLTFERRLDPASRRVTHMNARVAAGASNRPFRAGRSGEELVRLGYMDPQGRDGATFFAPDADVLLEESFAGAHCFSVQPGDDSHRGLIGLAFEPRVRSTRETFVDVRGVLWLNPDGPTLSDLEFRYTGLHPVVMQAGAGGTLRFQTMSNGVAFISEWTLLLPALLPGPSSRGPPSLVALGETGGIVVDATWPDGTAWKADIAGLGGRAVERGSGAPIGGALVTIEGSSDTVTADRSGVFTMAPLPPGLYALNVTDTTLSDFLRPRTVNRDVRIGRDVVAIGSLEFSSQAALETGLCRDQRGGGVSTLLGRVTDGDGSVVRDLVLEGTWQADYAFGRTAAVEITEARRTMEVDERGNFVVCRATLDRPVRLRLRLGKTPVADTVVFPARTPFHAVHWTLREGVLAAAERGDASSFVGSVINETTGAPVAGAEIWLVLDDVRVTTDSSGRFAIHGVSPQRHFVQVRRVGSVVRRDTVMLFAGRQTERQFRLTSQSVVLDTVRAVATGGRYISPALRGFEERRATGHGHFIAEDELRKNDNRTVENVLRQLPGIVVATSRTGAYAASNRGGGVSPSRGLPRADPTDPMSPRGCWVAVYLDGVPIYAGPPQPAPDLARMQVQDFAAVEFYPGGATVPIQYNATKKNDCGVLLLWTRER